MQDLQNAIDRYNQALNNLERWIAFKDASAAVGGIVGGVFIPPFSQNTEPPTQAEMDPYVAQWTSEYLT